MTEIKTTNRQRTKMTQAMKNVRERIETEQEAPLNSDQACTIYDFCDALGIEPEAVLGEAAALIDAPLSELEIVVTEVLVLQ